MFQGQHVKGQDVSNRRRTGGPRRPVDRAAPPAIEEVSVEEFVNDSRLPEGSLPICVRGDLYPEIESLDAELQRMLIDAGGDDRLAGNPRARELTRRIEALRAEMTRYTKRFHLRALERPDWNELKDRPEHAPREGNAYDQRVGVNMDVFSAALVPMMIYSPVFTPDQWARLKISDGQYDQLVDLAWKLNKGEVHVPFSLAALRVRMSDSQ